MDAFYASVEQLDNPALRGRPVIVGGGMRGVASTASYEARAFGVHSAMPVFQAKRLCPQGIFLPVRMQRYREVSAQIMTILRTVTPQVEPVSVDEAYLDLTGTERLQGDPLSLARKIKERIFRETGLTCSIGLAPNKFLAKIASDWKKPDGLTVIQEDQVEAFLRDLPVSKLPGVGRRTVRILYGLGITQTGELARFPETILVRKFGKFGHRLAELSRGIDTSAVIAPDKPKSISSEDTLDEDTDDPTILAHHVVTHAETVGRRLRRHGIKGRTITLKLKQSDFRLITRSHSVDPPTDSTKVIADTALELLTREKRTQRVRLIGVGVSCFEQGTGQLPLFAKGTPEEERRRRLDQAMDEVADRFGKGSLRRGE